MHTVTNVNSFLFYSTNFVADLRSFCIDQRSLQRDIRRRKRPADNAGLLDVFSCSLKRGLIDTFDFTFCFKVDAVDQKSLVILSEKDLGFSLDAFRRRIFTVQKNVQCH